MPPDDATRAEITRQLEEIKAEQKEFRREVMSELKDLRIELPRDYVRKEVLDALLMPINQQLASLQGTNTWVVRTVGGLVIAAVMALVLFSGGAR